jgi:2-polyprenyl-3-methyl-5-hydroxy-6-metoxy-1,4-benzoquinol methylase
MTIEARQPACISCGSHGTKLRLNAERLGLLLVECVECEMVFLDNWGDDFETELYDYYAQRIGRSQQEIFRDVNRIRYQELLGRFESIVAGRSILDVGCGQGQFVHTARDRGWNPLGIDLSASAIELGLSFGLPVRQLDFFSPDLAPGSFDVITMFELIEHVPRPGRFVARAEELLRPGGLLYLTTPNFGCIDRRLLGSEWRAISREHLSYFTPKSLGRLVERSSDLESLEISTRNISAGALFQAVKKLKRTGGAQSNGGTSRRERVASQRRFEQELRSVIERSAMLRQAKGWANRLLDAGGWGSAMIGLFRRPDA